MDAEASQEGHSCGTGVVDGKERLWRGPGMGWSGAGVGGGGQGEDDRKLTVTSDSRMDKVRNSAVRGGES